MKAILVIDVDNINSFRADVYKYDDKGNGELILNYCPLKPMPKEQHAKWSWGDDDFQRGWNACIDEILGEGQ